MTHHVEVRQLTSRGEEVNAFLNVDCDMGHIGVWGSSWKRPTYLMLMTDPLMFKLIQFDDEDWALEWLIEKAKPYDNVKIYRIEDDGEMSLMERVTP